MAKIQRELKKPKEKVVRFQPESKQQAKVSDPAYNIPYQNYYIDSFKLSIDANLLTSINIPENYILTDADTGAVLQEFKKNSLQLIYKNTSLWIGISRKQLNGMTYDKLMILFSSKVADNRYFYGIQKQNIIDVLMFLKDAGYINFTDISFIFKNLFTKDVDIKIDFRFNKEERERILEYNKILYDRFQFEKNECHLYKAIDNLGIQAFNRGRSTMAKPFVKFYDKLAELKKQNMPFYLTLPKEIQQELNTSFVYRLEYTMKDKKFFTKFGLSNRLEDVLEVRQSKWQEVGQTLLNTLFQYKAKKIRDNMKLNYIEKILSIQLFEDIQKRNISVHEARIKYVDIQPTKQQKYKAGLLFDKIYTSMTTNDAKETRNKYEFIHRFDKIFKLI
jgi:hypothetical protein